MILHGYNYIYISSNGKVEIQSEWRFKRINVHFQQHPSRWYQSFTSSPGKTDIGNSYDYTVILAWKVLWSYLLAYGKSALLYFYHDEARDSYINSSSIPYHNTLELTPWLINHNPNSNILQMVFISSHSFIHYTNESDSDIFHSAFYITIECSFKAVFSFNLDLKLLDKKLILFQLYYRPLYFFLALLDQGH